MRTPLPIDAVLPKVTAAGSCVLVAPTGAGKTLRVPPALLGDDGMVILVEPRRVASRAAARRMAHELGVELGGLVGYRVRFDDRTSRATRIVAVTPGVFLQMLRANPYLDGIAAVAFDEFHERGLETDLALGLVRLVREAIRPELRVVVMSATLDPGPVRDYLGVPAVTSQGRTFPITTLYRPRPRGLNWPQAVADAAQLAFSETDGDLLLFLPGVREIRDAMTRLDGFCNQHDVLLLPLYGDLPSEEQDRALRQYVKRKIVVSTNVAEASVTVEGVTGVVDSGVARQSQFDPALGLDRLILGPISRAEADQRAGRAGRTRPGVAVRLWDEPAHRTRPAEPVPEVHRADVAGALLTLAALNEPGFVWLEPPRDDSTEKARATLAALGALDDSGAITQLGLRLSGLPCPPRVGRLLLEAERLGCLGRAAIAAAVLTERGAFQPFSPSAGTESDIAERVAAIERDSRNVGEVTRAAAQYRRLFPPGRDWETGDDALLRAVAAAYPDRVARRRGPGDSRGVMVGGRGVRLTPGSAVRDAALFACVEVDAGAVESPVRLASAIERDWLEPRLIRTETLTEFDPRSEKLVGRRRTRYLDLVLDESSAPVPAGPASDAVLVAAALISLPRVLPPDDTAAGRLFARLRWLAATAPDLTAISLGDELFTELLPGLAAGNRSFAELRAAPWADAILDRLTYPERQALDRLAPDSLTVPSGSAIALDYAASVPVLAVRIQELFGLAETPRIAGGRVKVLLHLLAPNGRPQQVTDDLPSFWRGGYAVVRKELRGRYPKHSWPDDPLTAEPTRGGEAAVRVDKP